MILQPHTLQSKTYIKRGITVQTWSMHKTHNYVKAPDTKPPPSLKEIPDFFVLNSVRVWLH